MTETPEIVQTEEALSEESLPWSVRDTWLGLLMSIILIAVFLAIGVIYQKTLWFQTIGVFLAEIGIVLPILGLWLRRKMSWNDLGFRNFHGKFIGIGCGLLLAAYLIIYIHNLALFIFHISPQGNEILQLLSDSKSPGSILILGIIVAPLVEESFFRGFLFAGFRQKFGWKKAAILSSIIFALFHLDPVALIPTFVLGIVLAVLYQQSKSLWPGIMMHFLVNSFSLSMLFLISKLSIP